MANNLFKLIKSGRAEPFQKVGKSEIDVYSLIRCSSEEARELLPFKIAENLKVLPLAIIDLQRKRLLTVAAPSVSGELKKSIEFSCGIDVKLIPLEEDILKKAIFLAYNSTDRALTDNLKKLNEKSGLEKVYAPSFGVSNVKCEVNDFIKIILSYAIARKASDIHFMPGQEGLFIKLRIDGELRTHEKPICDGVIYRRIVSRIKTLARLDPTKSESPHDGSFTFDLDDANVGVRVGIMPTIHGEKIVLRLHGARDVLTLENLGIQHELLDFIERSIAKMNGLILFAGSTGSGKSTSLYAILERVSRYNKCILTVEDPVEMRLPFASQTSINTAKGVNYPDALKAALRQDPDCIMIGELRDSISAKIAFEAALTGHLVLTTLHAGGIEEAIQRLLEMGIDKLTLSQTSNLLVYQRLLPSLCNTCKVFDLEASKLNEFNAYKAVGCASCEYSGYSERVLAAEALMPDPSVRAAIVSMNQSTLKTSFNDQNYLSLESSLIRLREKGKIIHQAV